MLTIRQLCLSLSIAIICLAFSACMGIASRRSAPPAPAPADAPPIADTSPSDSAIRFLEARVRQDPDDFVAYNKLCGYYLQRQRETGNIQYLDLALRAARASLKAIPAQQNPGGLAALARAEFTTHDFAAARDHAMQLTQLDPNQGYPYELLGDALLELGEYDKAKAAYAQLERLSGIDSLSAQLRRARVALLYGRFDEAQAAYELARQIAEAALTNDRETLAWCTWQLGELSFAQGQYEAAEQHDREALTILPDYYRAVASLGRVRAARGDLPDAIKQYEQVTKRLPDPIYVAALGDLYKLAGREREAQAQYTLVEQIARLSALNGQLYNRQLALFYADHDLKPDEAYTLATREYEARRDIYGADAVAWAALKAGKLTEAQAAIKEALKLGTRDAKLFYHAGLIARAAGDKTSAHDYLKQALALNPQFEPLQVTFAQHALAE
jgi:tetratricopeptide (TPR) repeat protein